MIIDENVHGVAPSAKISECLASKEDRSMKAKKLASMMLTTSLYICVKMPFAFVEIVFIEDSIGC